MSNPRLFRRVLISCACVASALFFTARVAAQPSEGDRPVTVSVAGGFTGVAGRDAGRLDHGGNFQLSAGHFFNNNLGITANFSFNGLGITGRELGRLNQPDGNARVYSLTVDPVLRLPIRRRWSIYVLGGGGFLRRTIEFTQPTVAETLIIDPWWGYIGPGLIPVNQVLGSVSSNAGALDIGGGLNVPVPDTSLRMFVESRYLHGFTGKSGTSVVPVLVGIRW